MTHEWNVSQGRRPGESLEVRATPVRSGPYRASARGHAGERDERDSAVGLKDAVVVLVMLATLFMLGRLPALWNALGQAFLGWRS